MGSEQWRCRPEQRVAPSAAHRQLVVVAFTLKTLAGSTQHRMILATYGGFGLAVLLSGVVGLRAVVGQRS